MILYDHQKKIIAEDPKYTGLWLGTGTGKTLTALLLARGNILVICPKTQKEDQTWERQMKKIVKEMPCEYWWINTVPNIMKVVSKEEFKRDHTMIERFDTIIADEAHTALGATPNIRYVKKQPIPKNSQIFDALQEFVKRTNPERLYLCTATIIKNPMTVWAAGTLLGMKWNWYEWRDVFYTKLPMPGREVWAPKKDSATKDRLAAAVRRIGHVGRLEDFMDVPDQTFRTVHVDLTEAQRNRIKYLPLEFPDPIVLCGKKHQVENGVLAGNEFEAPETFQNEKVSKILDLALEFSKMIVFAKYTAQIEAIRSAVERFGRKVFVLSGDTKDRGKLILEASTSQEYVFIAQAQISAGWELPECPVMVFASKTYSFVDHDQALGRIQRANNIKKNLYISLVVKNGVDDAVEKCIANKCDFNERIYAEQNDDQT